MIRCPSMTGHDYFLATNAIIRFEESHWPDFAFVVMSLPRKQESRVLVPVSVEWLEAQYYAEPRFMPLP